MRRRTALSCLLLSCVATATAAAQSETAKIDPRLLAAAEAWGSAEFLVVLEEQADLSVASRLTSRRAKGQAVVAALRSTAERTQGPLLARLRSRGAEHRSFWVSNMIWAKGDAALIAEVARRPEVRAVAANSRVRQTLPRPLEVSSGGEASLAIPWGVDKIGAPLAWARGIDGSGIVIGGQDTGYQWTHPALRAAYRGSAGGGVDHNYNWHDAIHSASGNPCGVDSPEPCDDGSHGTHTMGTMLGRDGAEQIGVAPGARWIGCRNMDRGTGTPATYAECFQWFLAPTDLQGRHPDPARAPDVINNSWGCPPSEGCTDPNVLRSIVEAVRAAGIVVVVSAGNSGPRCGSVNNAPAIYDAAFSVAATDSNDGIASFSSRGPVTVDGSSRAKPDVSAPGVDVRSSVPGGYAEFDGTSMAGPHVAGLVALLLQARPELSGNVTAIERVLRDTAVPRTNQEDCGGTAGLFPNDTFGAGRIDALAAITSTGGSFFADTFDDGVRSTEWSYKGGTWKEQGGVLTSAAGEALAQRAFGGCDLCTVEATLEVARGRGGSASLVAWRGGAKSYVEVRLLESEDRWQLIQRQGNRTVQSIASRPIAAATAYDVRVSFDGSQFVLGVGGVELTRLAKIPGTLPFGTVGFRAAGRASRFDRVSVE